MSAPDNALPWLRACSPGLGLTLLFLFPLWFEVKNNLHFGEQVNRMRASLQSVAVHRSVRGLIDFTRGLEVTHQLANNKTSQTAVKEMVK